MAYSILNPNGTTLLILADGQVDTSATSLTLIGKNYASYGQELNNNFVKLLANFANTAGSPPRSPITGQLWYNTTLGRLQVYDNGFKTIGAVAVSASVPATLQTGDLWFDTTTKQLKIVSAGTLFTVGPTLPTNIGTSGLVLPETTITDKDDIAKEVILLKSYGTTLGVLYYDNTDQNESFVINDDDKEDYISNATTSTIVSGITVLGDLNVQGKLSTNYLTVSVDLDIVSPNPNNDALDFYGGSPAATVQNNKIANILNELYPPAKTVLSSTSTQMFGLIPGTQARVLCKFSSILNVVRNGYQVRVFRTIGTGSVSTSWQPYYYTTATISSFTNVPVNYISTSTN